MVADADEPALRRSIDARPDRPEDAICEAVSLAVSDALADGALLDHLAAAGWQLVRAPGGRAPEAPATWMHDGLDTALPGWMDPLSHLAQLWDRAWTAGYTAAGADQAAAASQAREIARLAAERDSMVADLYRALYPGGARPDRPLDTVWNLCVGEARRLAELYDAHPQPLGLPERPG